MKKKSLKTLIKQVRAELEWPILEKSHEMPVIRIASYPRTRSHVFLMPNKLHNKSTDLDYLHELGHAYLCEKVHPVFSATSQFSSEKDKRQFLMAIPALNAACDWFIGHWQMELSPQEARKQLQENIPIAEEVLAAPQLPPLEIILDAALLIAEGINYLEEPFECQGVLKTVVDAFLSVPPGQPSADNCSLLVNRLMSTYTDHRARLINQDGYHVWDIYLPDTASHDSASDPTRETTV
ncbi:hypothetical protein KI809_14950 [Geobacter pelophilus]|uniref:IrrE N-terminal-like domain-containing protein n=1 Tax=Geoanaerobacter pelophilus TaxID=60036 RepID=A0AAW4LAL3_9BACT|nr:hypothetical protein [Geoanaerobacter pelophilus]MBT0665605.1 hypothetical protein [Geoanaerobacter pelophilus]